MNGQSVIDDRRHVFVAYAAEDTKRVDDLQRYLENGRLRVWRYSDELRPAENWKIATSRAIRDGLAFIACFSEHTDRKTKSYLHEELLTAVEEMRRYPADQSWLFVVRFDDCKLPPMDLGAGRDLESLQHVDLFDGQWGLGPNRLIAALLRVRASSPVVDRESPISRSSQERS